MKISISYVVWVDYIGKGFLRDYLGNMMNTDKNFFNTSIIPVEIIPVLL